jgi:hypothetical protein
MWSAPAWRQPLKILQLPLLKDNEMKSEKIIIQLKDLSKVYQMGEEISVKALDHINLGYFPSQY